MAFLVITERPIKELIDGFTAFTFANPHNASFFQIIDDGGVFMSFTVRDLVNAECFQISDAMILPGACNRTMQHIRQCGGGDMQQHGRSFLGHDLTVYKHRKFEAVRDS
jgi:hypothetical protein